MYAGCVWALLINQNCIQACVRKNIGWTDRQTDIKLLFYAYCCGCNHHNNAHYNLIYVRYSYLRSSAVVSVLQLLMMFICHVGNSKQLTFREDNNIKFNKIKQYNRQTQTDRHTVYSVDIRL